MGGFYFFGGLILAFLIGVGLLSLGAYMLWKLIKMARFDGSSLLILHNLTFCKLEIFLCLRSCTVGLVEEKATDMINTIPKYCCLSNLNPQSK
ncbi:hypothetical protein [Bacillus subtilis]|uniref:hypothetical protein n=1 Tax=Bacillus subtilis TaxID=1423 RepID=UPI003F13C38E